jgi:hypothetical protein
MAKKALRNLALLGGLGAAAMMMGRKKKGEEGTDTTDTTADASAGRAKDRLGGAGFDRGSLDTSGDASAGQARDRLADLEKARPSRRAASDSDSGSVRTPGREAPATPAASEPTASADTGDESRRLMRRAGVFDKNMMTGEETIRDFNERIDPRFTKGLTYGRRAEMRMPTMKKGGSVKAKPKMSSASKRADGIAIRGKTKGRMV